MKTPNLKNFVGSVEAVSDSSTLCDRGLQMSGKSLLSQLIKTHSSFTGGNKRF